MADTEVARKETHEERTTRVLLEELAKLGGQLTKESDLVFEGTRMVVPASMTPADAVRFLKRWIESQEEEAAFSRTFPYRPNDGAHALQEALRELFGTVGIGKATWSFFEGRQPPPVMSIDVDVDKTEQVPFGQMDLPHLHGTIMIGGKRDREKGALFHLSVTVPRKYGAHVEGLFRLVEKKLREKSIYRGKAITGAETPQFIDPFKVNEKSVVYSEEVLAQLNANVWTVVEQTALLKSLGLPIKRAVLLGGPYGTGKSLAAMLTAQRCLNEGWTFIQCRPADDLTVTMQTAQLYAPAVVFFEDVDVLADNGDPDAVRKLLDTFDGIGAKGSEIMVVLTTNHVDRIHRGMLRPGRLDAVIEIGHLDEPGVRKLVEVTVPNGHLAADIDWTSVFAAFEGYLPAFVREATERALRYGIVRTGGKPDVLTTEDLVHAGNGLRAQYDLMNGAGEGKTKPSLDQAVRDAVQGAVDGSKFVDRDEDAMFTLRVSVDGNAEQL